METIVTENWHVGEVTDMSIKRMSERDLKAEFSGKPTPDEIIDAFEEERGIKPKKAKSQNLKHGVEIFDLTNDRDKKLYLALLNSKGRYVVWKFIDNFNSVTGRYTIVCHYSEDLDSEEPAVKLDENGDVVTT